MRDHIARDIETGQPVSEPMKRKISMSFSIQVEDIPGSFASMAAAPAGRSF